MKNFLFPKGFRTDKSRDGRLRRYIYKGLTSGGLLAVVLSVFHIDNACDINDQVWAFVLGAAPGLGALGYGLSVLWLLYEKAFGVDGTY